MLRAAFVHKFTYAFMAAPIRPIQVGSSDIRAGIRLLTGLLPAIDTLAFQRLLCVPHLLRGSSHVDLARSSKPRVFELMNDYSLSTHIYPLILTLTDITYNIFQ